MDLVLRIAGAVARRLPSHVDIKELISAGNVGLVDAAIKYDASLGHPFDAFAVPRIRGAMYDFIREIDTLSRDMRRLSKHMHVTTHALAVRLNRTPDDSEIAKALGVNADELGVMRTKLSGERVVSYDEFGDDVGTFWDRTGDDHNNPLRLRIKGEESERLEAAIKTLPLNLQRVLSLRFVQDLRLEEIGRVMGFSESRACQLVALAIRELRKIVDPDMASS